MDKKKAEQAKGLLYELERVQDIRIVMEKEQDHWWSFITSDTKSWERDGLYMPKVVREEFTKAVDRSIERLEKQIEEL